MLSGDRAPPGKAYAAVVWFMLGNSVSVLKLLIKHFLHNFSVSLEIHYLVVKSFAKGSLVHGGLDRFYELSTGVVISA